MRFRVFPLCRKGRRLPWREVQNRPSFSGDLITHSLEVNGEWFMVATLRNPVSPAVEPLLPELREPVLVWVTPPAQQLRGFERCEDPDGLFSVVQEWHCESA